MSLSLSGRRTNRNSAIPDGLELQALLKRLSSHSLEERDINHNTGTGDNNSLSSHTSGSGGIHSLVLLFIPSLHHLCFFSSFIFSKGPSSISVLLSSLFFVPKFVYLSFSPDSFLLSLLYSAVFGSFGGSFVLSFVHAIVCSLLRSL